MNLETAFHRHLMEKGFNHTSALSCTAYVKKEASLVANVPWASGWFDVRNSDIIFDLLGRYVLEWMDGEEEEFWFRPLFDKGEMEARRNQLKRPTVAKQEGGEA